MKKNFENAIAVVAKKVMGVKVNKCVTVDEFWNKNVCHRGNVEIGVDENGNKWRLEYDGWYVSDESKGSFGVHISLSVKGADMGRYDKVIKCKVKTDVEFVACGGYLYNAIEAINNAIKEALDKVIKEAINDFNRENMEFLKEYIYTIVENKIYTMSLFYGIESVAEYESMIDTNDINVDEVKNTIVEAAENSAKEISADVKMRENDVYEYDKWCYALNDLLSKKYGDKVFDVVIENKLYDVFTEKIFAIISEARGLEIAEYNDKCVVFQKENDNINNEIPEQNVGVSKAGVGLNYVDDTIEEFFEEVGCDYEYRTENIVNYIGKYLGEVEFSRYMSLTDVAEDGAYITIEKDPDENVYMVEGFSESAYYKWFTPETKMVDVFNYLFNEVSNEAKENFSKEVFWAVKDFICDEWDNFKDECEGDVVTINMAQITNDFIDYIWENLDNVGYFDVYIETKSDLDWFIIEEGINEDLEREVVEAYGHILEEKFETEYEYNCNDQAFIAI
jgi:hypothetical protein